MRWFDPQETRLSGLGINSINGRREDSGLYLEKGPKWRERRACKRDLDGFFWEGREKPEGGSIKEAQRQEFSRGIDQVFNAIENQAEISDSNWGTFYKIIDILKCQHQDIKRKIEKWSLKETKKSMKTENAMHDLRFPFAVSSIIFNGYIIIHIIKFIPLYLS